MWPLWLIVAVAVSGATVLTTCSVLAAVFVERRRHKSFVSRHGLDRNLSQYHRPHLSITDVDFSNLPRPVRSLRQSLHSPRRDSRFYSTMPSQDEIRTFPDGTAESIVEASYNHIVVDRQNQWLKPGKSRKEHRKKKSIKLSISAPMARSPMSAITEQTESTRQGSPEPVELPTQSTPKETPDKQSISPNPTSMNVRHVKQDSIGSVRSIPDKSSNRVSTRISHGNAVKSRSISMGSIAPPPNCPLPPVPEAETHNNRKRSLSKSQSDLSIDHRSLSLLNSPLSLQHVATPSQPGETVQRALAPSSFDFGLHDDTVQVIKVESDLPSSNFRLEGAGQCSVRSSNRSPQLVPPTICIEDGMKAKDSHRSSLYTNLQNTASSAPKLSSNISEPGSRPVSAISAMSLAEYGMLHSTRSSPVRSAHGPPSRPISVSSIDMFRQSVIGPNIPVLMPDSPRSKGHKRQNCVRISGLVPVDATRKRLSSQLDKLTEAEETDGDDDGHKRIEIPTISPAKVSVRESPVMTTKLSERTLEVPKLRQPQAQSLRVKRPGLLDRVEASSLSPKTMSFNTVTNELDQQAQKQLSFSPPLRPLKPIYHSQSMKSTFIYAGSPSSDPTKPRPVEQEYSPISPPTPVQSAVMKVATPPKNEQPLSPKLSPRTIYSPASSSILFSPAISPVRNREPFPNMNNSGANGDRTQHARVTSSLYGPRNAPPPSLRVRNNTNYNQRTSPRLRQTSGQRSSSPIRKTSQTRNSNNIGQQRHAMSTQDELRKSIALLKSLTHAAEAAKGGGLGDINIIGRNGETATTTTANMEKAPALPKTPRGRHAESLNTAVGTQERVKSHSQTSRQRSKTIAGYAVVPPQLRHEPTDPSSGNTSQKANTSCSPSRISIWEDASVKGDDSDGESQITSQTTNLIPHGANQLSDHPKQVRRSLTNIQQQITSAMPTATQEDPLTKPLQKESLWRLQQNADLITSRALAIGSIVPTNASKSPQSARERINDLKQSKHIPTSPQTDSSPSDASGIAAQQHQQQRSGSRITGPRPRQRSHTVTAASMSVPRSTASGEDFERIKPLKTREGVGLGVDFGRTGYGREMNTKVGGRGNSCIESERGSNIGCVFFVNEMERDGIGQLR